MIIASPGKRRMAGLAALRAQSFGALVALACVMLAPMAGYAQSADGSSSGPVRLFPGAGASSQPEGAAPTPTRTPTPEQPAFGAPSSGSSFDQGYDVGPSRSVIGSGDNAVEVAPLRALADDAVGLIDEASDGLPADMWAGTPRALAYSGVLGLAKPSAQIRSQAGRALAIRFLTTAAPGANSGSGNPPAGDFVAARIRALIALGALEPAKSLADAASDVPKTAMLARARNDAQLAAGDIPGACADARSLAQNSTDSHWQKLLVFCQAAAGSTGEARFGLDLMVEMGVEDTLFMTLADGLASGRVPTLSSADPRDFTPLHAAMARTLGAAPPDAVAVEGTAPAVAALLAVKPKALALAEAAAWRGVLDTSRLAEIYAGADFAPDALDNPLSAAENLDGAHARALLYQSLAIQNVPAAKAELLRAAFAVSARDGIYPLAAVIFADQVMQLPPGPDLGFFAQTAARALFAAGKPERAERWHALIRARAVGEAQTGADQTQGSMSAARDQLWALGRLAGTIPLQEGALATLAAFEKGLFARAPDQAGDLLLRVYLPLLALEPEARAIRTGVARRAFAGGLVEATIANPAAGAMMRLAADDGRVAEVVLFALLRLGDLHSAEIEPSSLADIAGALAAVGLARDARYLTLEAAISAGL